MRRRNFFGAVGAVTAGLLLAPFRFATGTAGPRLSADTVNAYIKCKLRHLIEQDPLLRTLEYRMNFVPGAGRPWAGAQWLYGCDLKDKWGQLFLAINPGASFCDLVQGHLDFAVKGFVDHLRVTAKRFPGAVAVEVLNKQLLEFEVDYDITLETKLVCLMSYYQVVGKDGRRWGRES
jgi:hypothetical protein